MNVKTFSIVAVSLMICSAFACCCSLFDEDSSAGGTLHKSVTVGTYVDFSYTETDPGWDVCYVDVDYELPGMNYSMNGQTVRIYGTPQTAGRYQINVVTFYPYEEIEGGFLMWVDVSNPIVNYTVSFNANGGTSSTASSTVTNGTQITLPSASKPYCTFSGWFTAASGGTRVGGAGDNYTVSSNTTLYAQYNVIPVSITTTQGTAYLVQGTSFAYTVGTSPAEASVTVSGADWLTVSNKTVTGVPTASAAPAGTYHITVTAQYGTQSAVQTFDIVVAEKLIFESIPTGGIIATPV